MTGKHSNSILEVVKQFFEADGWRFSQVEGKPVLRTGYSGKHLFMNCIAQTDEEGQQFLFYSIFEFQAPAEKRDEIVEFITRANFGVWLGNFELDYSDGQIRYKTSMNVKGGELTAEMVKTLVHANVAMMDKFGPGIMAVLYGGVLPARAIARIRG